MPHQYLFAPINPSVVALSILDFVLQTTGLPPFCQATFLIHLSLVTPFSPKSNHQKEMNWIQRKILLFDVTFGSYDAEWWERGILYMLGFSVLWVISASVLRLGFVLYDGLLK